MNDISRLLHVLASFLSQISGTEFVRRIAVFTSVCSIELSSFSFQFGIFRAIVFFIEVLKAMELLELD